MARVEVTRHLHTYFPVLAQAELVVPGATVAELVAELEKMAPGFSFYVCDERGRLRQHVNIFVEQEMISDRKHLSDVVQENARVFIMQALSGG